MDSNEIMELIEGAKSMTETKPTVKTVLTRDEIVELLNLYQVMDDILQDPNHWRPYVMPDDDRAWYHTPKED